MILCHANRRQRISVELCTLYLAEENEVLDIITRQDGSGDNAELRHAFRAHQQDLRCNSSAYNSKDPERQGAPVDVKKDQEGGRWFRELDQGLT